MTVDAQLRALRDRWSPAKPHERGSAQAYLIELCEAIGVERPRPPGSGYEFELTVDAVTVEGKESKNFIDLWKAGHFALEAKDDDKGKSNDLLLRRAFGQVRNYVAHTPGDAPPYIMVLDVGRTLVVWDRWSGSYGGYAAGRRIDLPTLHERPDDVALLRDIWEQPSARDPRGRAQAVTTEIAGRLARLAALLEGRGIPQERVARFLMRVVFSCFAEDIGLLPQEAFRQTVVQAGVNGSPEQFAAAVAGLWRAMDEGAFFGFLKLLRFNGHFFREAHGGPAEALPLTRDDLTLLHEAAAADWARVEPSIFGTLLVRALDPIERHRLGAEYTPRAFIERLVRPAVEEPLRERWTAAQAEVLQLRESGKKKDRERALARLTTFHEWLRGLRFLDPACGSGNFLYVTMHMIKRLELEVIREIETTKGQAELRFEEVGPWQFHGIEVKRWAREIAELTLWIGFHQFWREHHGVQPSEPILRDTGTLEWRDAVLEWDAVEDDAARSEPDPTPCVAHPVTGRLVPDPAAHRAYQHHVGARPAPWPEADFVIGNPPYIGGTEMRETLGSGYVDALRAAYPGVPDGADFVMYWWARAAEAVASGRTVRAGLITTNSITQVRNRRLVEAAAERDVRVAWAVADHPWVEDSDGAAVRVALTVVAQDPPRATLVRVNDAAREVASLTVPRLNADLSAHADVPTAAKVALKANEGLSFTGFQLFGDGFILEPAEAEKLLRVDARHAQIIKPYRNGRDLTARPRGVYVIDFGLREEAEARAWPVLFDIVRDRVKPERDANRRPSLARSWWRFGYPRGELRQALAGLPRYIATVETMKHRVFTFLDAAVAPDNMLTVVATADAYVLGVLSSSTHITWALAAGGRLGVGNDPRYQKTLCFEPFPFPDATLAHRAAIADVAERLDQHRRDALARDPKVTLTGMYNALAAVRTGATLSVKEREVHTLAAVGGLRDLHDELDRRVAEAYGWSWPEPAPLVLERLVMLHDVRVGEEGAGTVRWLRPDYQRSRVNAAPAAAPSTQPAATASEPATTSSVAPTLARWPSDAVGQITAVREVATGGPVSVVEVVGRFSGARADLVARHLETLSILGEVRDVGGGRYVATTVTV